MFHNIPEELKALRQWVICKDLVTKVPLTPETAIPASVSDPRTWGTFEAALRSGAPGIGFVLSSNDPYVCIDLDDKPHNPATDEQKERFSKLTEQLESYTEISNSGRGAHIFCKSKNVQSCRKDNVEIYFKNHFILTTGNIISKDREIADRSDMIETMVSQIVATRQSAALAWRLPEHDDEEILRRAREARNGSGEKFQKLWKGGRMYHSQSEDDFALLSLLAFYSVSDEQVMRLFRRSELGKREKAQRRDYLERSLEKIRPTLEKPKIDFSNLRFPEKEKKPQTDEEPLTYPPGLMGEIAKYIYASSIRPVHEVSLTAAMGLMSGICGRSYNISGMGLNQYIMLIAETGRGKEDGPKGIDRLISCVKEWVPSADECLGPGEFASGQALIRTLDNNACFLSIFGEIGLTLGRMSGKNVPPNLQMLKKVLLDIYNKSGRNSFLRSSAYADSEKNTKTITSPNVSILGDGSTESFFDNLDTSDIGNGLIPRFLIVEYKGPRVRKNKTPFGYPTEELIRNIAHLIGTAGNNSLANIATDVPMTKEAEKLLDDYDERIDKAINLSNDHVESELLNRAHVKALKLAALVGIGKTVAEPLIDEECAQWAINFVERSNRVLIDRFQNGEIGLGDSRQDTDLRNGILKFFTLDVKQKKHYNVSSQLLNENVIPANFLKKYLRHRASFKNDYKGAYTAIETMIERYVKEDYLRHIPSETAFEKYGTRQNIYVLGNNWH